MFRRKQEVALSQPESVLATVSRLEALTDRLEETTAELKAMLARIAREEARDIGV
jgi:tetrahydromethanopterin S-methyltransferase subunit G